MRKTNISKKSLAWLICLLLSVLVFILLLLIIKNVMERKEEKVKAVVALENIAANTVIRAEDAGEYFAEEQIPANLCYEGSCESLEEIFADGDIFLTETLTKGEIVAADMLARSNELTEGYVCPVTLGIKAASFENAAGGILRRGDLVDLSTTDAAGNELTIRTYILQAFDGSGKRIETGDRESVATAFNILIERDDYEEVMEILSVKTDFDLIKVNEVY